MWKSNTFSFSSKIRLRLCDLMSVIRKSHQILDCPSFSSSFPIYVIVHQFLPVLCSRYLLYPSPVSFATAPVLVSYFRCFPASRLVLCRPATEFAAYATLSTTLSGCCSFACTILFPGLSSFARCMSVSPSRLPQESIVVDVYKDLEHSYLINTVQNTFTHCLVSPATLW